MASTFVSGGTPSPGEPVVLFLHGYGGNFQFYTWVLKEEFPDAVILTPSWGMSWHRGSATYLKEMIADAEKQVGVSLDRPWLMGISAGGRGGFALYNPVREGAAVPALSLRADFFSPTGASARAGLTAALAAAFGLAQAQAWRGCPERATDRGAERIADLR